MEDCQVLIGDCLTVLKEIPDDSIQCCVTSPPYFGLRDYGHPGQIGLEKSVDEYVEKLVLVFREIRRVLRSDGTLWLNLGDSYSSSGGNHGGRKDNQPGVGGKRVFENKSGDSGNRRPVSGLKPKDLIGIPWRVAFALQADGWCLRQDIIWAKPNPMPESVTDRCTKSHEYLFLLAKSEKYFFDHKAIKEPAVSGHAAGNQTNRKTAAYDSGDEKHRLAGGFLKVSKTVYETRNRRSVWSVNVRPYKGAHFATYPPELVIPCVLAGCPRGGTVIDPFGGSGTTGSVAISLGRQAVLIELNPEYKPLIQERIQKARDSLAQGKLIEDDA